MAASEPSIVTIDASGGTPDEAPPIVVRAPSEVTLLTSQGPDGLVTISLTWPAGVRWQVEIEGPLGQAIGLWNPAMRATRTLPPDWRPGQITSLVDSAPVVVPYDAQSQALWGVACSQVVSEVEVQGGVSEERKSLRLMMSAPSNQSESDAGSVQIALWPSAGTLPAVVTRLVTWVGEVNEIDPLPAPEMAREPVFSTWYTYTQDVTDDRVRAEAALSTPLGCRTMFIDDGWQLGGHGRGYGGCGEWLPDLEKFPDLAGTVAALQDAGMSTVLWIAPLLLGHSSNVFDQWRDYAPVEMKGQNCQVLDPRYREVREFVAQTCARLVRDYRLAGLKIDFLNNAMSYAATASPGDVADVGEAMRQMLALIRARLADLGLAEPIIEFRQPYVSPAITAYGTCIRVRDCPADALINRSAGVDLRLFLRGAVVHADPIMWARDGGAIAVAQQFSSTFFTVPQVSMPLGDLDQTQRDAVAHQLRLWRSWREVALSNDLAVSGVELGYTLVRASAGRRSVIARYRPEAITLADLDADEVLVLNATFEPAVVLRQAAGWTVAEVLDASGGEHSGGEQSGSGQSGGVIDADVSQLSVPAFGSARLTRSR